MIKLTNGIDTIQVSDITNIDGFVVLTWGQYSRVMPVEEFLTFSVIE